MGDIEETRIMEMRKYVVIHTTSDHWGSEVRICKAMNIA